LGGAAGGGTVFKLNPDGSGFAVLKNLDSTTGTSPSPFAGLMQGIDGSLYGTCSFGGSNNLGTIFKMNPDGTGFTVLHHFDGFTFGDSLEPGELVQGPGGVLYGTCVGEATRTTAHCSN
jgi:uncharacterized repeat protein (TIGR03803 family)